LGLSDVAYGRSSNVIELVPLSTWVSVEIDRGCVFMSTVGSRRIIPPGATFEWSGACEVGKAIDGPGVLRTEVGEDFSATAEGTFVRGVPHGPVIITRFSSGEMIDRFADEYNMGCGASDIDCVPYVPAPHE
jgi:hypothetical protein